jgi:hypothetical protein
MAIQTAIFSKIRSAFFLFLHLFHSLQFLFLGAHDRPSLELLHGEATVSASSVAASHWWA